MYKSLKYLLFVLIIVATSLNQAFAGCGLFEWYIHHYSEPILTTGAGGGSSRLSPKIRVRYEGCFSIFAKVSGEAILNPNENENMIEMHRFGYYAAALLNDDVCNNKCMFGVLKEREGECGFTGPTCSIKDNSSGAECVAPIDSPACAVQRCDYQLAAQYLELCRNSNLVIGICGYRTTIDQAIRGTLAGQNPGAVTDPNSYMSASTFESNTGLVPSNENGHHCYPMPLKPMPQPFCNWDGQRVDATPQDVIPTSPSQVSVNTIAFCEAPPNQAPNQDIACMKVSLDNGTTCTMSIQVPLPAPSDPSSSLYAPSNKDCPESFKLAKAKVPNPAGLDPSTNIRVPDCLLDQSKLNNKLCLNGPSLKDLSAVVCDPSNVCTLSCDLLKMCIDVYPFKFDCKKAIETVNTKNSDGTTTTTNKDLSQECGTDIFNYCFQVNESDKGSYEHSNQCIDNYKTCLSTPTKSVQFASDTFWNCSTVNKIITNR